MDPPGGIGGGAGGEQGEGGALGGGGGAKTTWQQPWQTHALASESDGGCCEVSALSMSHVRLK